MAGVPEASPSAPPRRALILFDEPVINRTIGLTLNHGEYVTRDASTVGDALAILEEWEPHLAVCDMELGGIAFLEAVGGTGGAVPTKIPVLALTRKGDLATKLSAFDHGADDILSVPFSPEGQPSRSASWRYHESTRSGRLLGASSHALGAEPPLSVGGKRRAGDQPDRDSGRAVGDRLHCREQHCGPAHPCPACQAAE
jgi:CheY-like chemotaxis protein